GFREHHAGIDDDDVVAVAQRHHVHAEFAETAERNCEKGLQRLGQRDVSSESRREIVSQRRERPPLTRHAQSLFTFVGRWKTSEKCPRELLRPRLLQLVNSKSLRP